MNQLPTYKGYTMDVRLKEFRKADVKKSIQFIPFDSDKGDKLLSGYLKTLGRKRMMEVAGEVF